MSFLLFYDQECSQEGSKGSFLTPHETMEMWQFKMSEKIPKDANVLFQSKDRPGTPAPVRTGVFGWTRPRFLKALTRSQNRVQLFN